MVAKERPFRVQRDFVKINTLLMCFLYQLPRTRDRRELAGFNQSKQLS